LEKYLEVVDLEPGGGRTRGRCHGSSVRGSPITVIMVLGFGRGGYKPYPEIQVASNMPFSGGSY